MNAFKATQNFDNFLIPGIAVKSISRYSDIHTRTNRKCSVEDFEPRNISNWLCQMVKFQMKAGFREVYVC